MYFGSPAIYIIKILLFLMFLLVGSLPCGADVESSSARVSVAVPEGFEAWSRPQVTAVDVYYGGRFLLAAMVEYTPESLIFLSPHEVVSKVPDLKDELALETFLTQPLPTNTQYLCTTSSQVGCGLLTPEYAGIIFDERRFHAELFINRDLLRQLERDEFYYLPDPDVDTAGWVQSLRVLTSGIYGEEGRFSLSGGTNIGYMQGFGFAEWLVTDQQAVSFSRVGYRRDFQDHYFTLGVVEPGSGVFRNLPMASIFGVRFGRSLLRRTDYDNASASPVEVYLPQYSRVDIFRDDRLIASGFYEAGFQSVDTRDFPLGNYNIDIVVTGPGGGISESRQLFVKLPSLAPPGEPQWFLEGGVPVIQHTQHWAPRVVGSGTVRGGYRWRERSWLGLGIAGTVTRDVMLGEFSGTIYRDWLELEGAFSTDGRGWAGSVQGRVRWQDTLVSANARYSRSAEGREGSLGSWLLTEKQSHGSLRISQRLGGWGTVSLMLNERLHDGGQRFSSKALRYWHLVSLSDRHALTLSGELVEVNDDIQLMIGLEWRMSNQSVSHSAGLHYRWEEDVAHESVQRLSTRWLGGDRFTDEIEAGLMAQMEPSGHELLSGDITHNSAYGSGRISVSHADLGARREVQYLASYDTNVVLGQDVGMLWGGGRGEGAVVLELQGAPEGVLDIEVDGQKLATLQADRRVAVGLPSYDEYRVDVLDAGRGFVDIDGEARDIVVYPGHVQRLRWSFTATHVLIGRLWHASDSCGIGRNECNRAQRAISGATISTALNEVVTQEDGFFQLEIPADTDTLDVVWEGRACQLDIEELPVNHGVILANELHCHFR